MLHIPLLRKGKPYKSLDVIRLPHHRTREPVAEISQANTGLLRRDLLEQASAREALCTFSHGELIQLCERAAEHFTRDSLPLGDAQQSAQDYVEQVSATTGLPLVLARKNMHKIRTALAQMSQIVAGLTRQLDLGILDAGFGEVEGQALSFYPRTQALGVVLPSNSPGVHSLWAPAVALKMPLVLKPGSAEPWTPYRMAQAFLRAGVPAEAFSYYPTGHEGANEILRICGRGMFFGDAASLRRWERDPRIELHGPGQSKLVIGEDAIERWQDYLEVMVSSILENAGRSCVNASSIRVPRYGKEIAHALAQRLASVVPRAAEDNEAQLAAMSDASLAARISQAVEAGLAEPGARDVTAEYRKGERVSYWNDCAYLLPTIILCESPGHPLANLELLFPFASVVETREAELPESLGASLVVTAITSNPKLTHRLASSPLVGRLNLGPIPTHKVRWDQPHEGNLFDHLYGRRAFQSALAGV